MASRRTAVALLGFVSALALLAGVQCASVWERAKKGLSLVLASLGVLIGISLIAIAATVSATTWALAPG